MIRSYALLPWLSACLVAACGGGDTTAAQIAANLAPSFTSSAQVSITENTTGTLYIVTATDPNGDALTISAVPGGDEGAFDIDVSTGTVRSAVALDYENPSDTDGDNVYMLTFEVRDPSGLTARLNVSITVQDVVETMALRRVGAGFSQPLFLHGLPGETRVLVLEKSGRIRLLDPDTGAVGSVDFLDVSTTISSAGEGGLLGLALSPNFLTDRALYLNVTNGRGDTEIRRYTMFSGSDVQADPATSDVILTFTQPDTNHNAGWLGFSNDGLLYIPTGDGGGSGDPSNNAQNSNSLLGKVLRIDVSRDGFPTDPQRDYGIPPGNAFSGAAGREEIFALGLRNPFRSSFDRVTGDLFMGDVGQGAIEEIDRLRPGDSGTNYGWDDQEGTQDFDSPDRTELVDPVAEYRRGTGPLEGNSVTGGYVHRGNVQPIRDHYVFGDFISGNVWAMPVADLIVGQTVAAAQFIRLNDQLVPDAGSLSQISSFGEDEAGNLYIVSLGGDVFRIESQP